SKPREIISFATPGQAREDVVDAEEDLALGQIHEQGDEIIAAALNLNVVAFADAVNTDMQLGTAGHPDGYFFAEEEVGVTPEGLGDFNRVMVGDGNDGHAQAFQPGVHLERVIVGLPGKPGEARSAEHSGGDGVNVKVAAHGDILRCGYEQSVKQ